MSDASFGGDSLPGGSREDRRGRKAGGRGRKKRRGALAAALEALESRSMLAANVLEVAKVMWDGKLVEAVKNEYVLRMPQLNAATAKSPADYQSRIPAVQRGWSLQTLGSGFFKLTAPGATQSTLTAWARTNGVQSVNVNAVRTLAKTPNDPLYGDTANWAFPKISADKAWDVGTGTPSTIVAVIDSGVDYNHPDLRDNMWKNPNEIDGDGIDNDRNGWVDDVYGVNTIGGNANPMDENGHGTFCAGLIAAVGNNAVGMAGVNWTAKVMAVKVFDADGNTSIAAIISGYQYIIGQKIAGQNVVAANCSFGGYSFVQQEFDAVNQLSQAGVLVVAAAGNAFGNNDVVPVYPASYTIPGIVSVAASTTTDTLANFSNYGVSSVDLAAPGVAVLSTRASLSGDPPYNGNTGYAVSSGTSFAAPLVAGTAGLLKSIKPSASVQQVKDAILGGVDKIPSLAGQVLTGGRLNVANAVALINTTGSTPTASFKSGQGLKFLEGHSGFAYADVKVVLDRPSAPGQSATVWFDTQAGGSAGSGSDFIAQSGSVTFSGNETEKSIRIQLIGERTPEADEQFAIKLDPAKSKGVAIGGGLATVTILDDDQNQIPGQPGGTDPLLPVVSLAPKMQPAPSGPNMVPVPIREGGQATFVISLDRTSNKTISVQYRTNQPTLVPAGTALAGIDYVATSGTMTFKPGERSKEFTVSILADRIADDNETFRVVLTAPRNAELAGETGAVASAITATISDQAFVPPPATGFQITITYPDSTLTTSQKAVFQQAASRWEEIIVGDLPNVTDPSTGQVIDDIIISATAPAIDGAGGILGQAGPTDVRSGPRGLPWKGIMEFDSADLAALEANGTLKDVILHEMGHVLGFGGLWQSFGLVTGLGGNNPLYVGTNALREYRSLFGVPTATGVPVENQGGPGTAGVHWRESVLVTELMTGFAEPAGTPMPISRITLGALQDLGYRVNYAKADSYAKPAMQPPAPPAAKPKLRLASLTPRIGASVTPAARPALTAAAAAAVAAPASRPAVAAAGKTAFAALAAAVPSQAAGVGTGQPSGRQVFAAIGRR
jgi:subtilisin family serine protease